MCVVQEYFYDFSANWLIMFDSVLCLLIATRAFQYLLPVGTKNKEHLQVFIEKEHLSKK